MDTAAQNESELNPPVVRHEISKTPPAPSSDFIPPIVGRPSAMRYLWLVLIGFLVLSVVGGGAYLIDSENRKEPSQISALLTPTPEVPQPIVQVTVDPHANWQKFSDTEAGFSFAYPPDLTLAKGADNSVTLADQGGTTVITMAVVDVQKKFISADSYESCSVVLNSAYTGKQNKCVSEDKSKVRFGSTDADHFVYIEVGNSGGGYDIYQTVSPALQFTLTFASGKADGEQEFQHILPTFAFFTPTPASAAASIATPSGKLR